MQELPDTTVCIPFHNAPVKLFNELVASLDKQSFKNFMVIVYDDCSDDKESLENLERVISSRRESWVVVRAEKNRGVSHARNELFRLAKTPYVMFSDADDLLYGRKIEVMRGRLINSEADCVFCDFSTDIGINGTPSNDLRVSKGLVFTSYPTIIEHVAHGMYRREAIVDKVMFDENLKSVEDLKFFYDLIKAGKRIIKVPEKLFLYRYKGNEGSLSKGSDLFKNLYKVFAYCVKEEFGLEVTENVARVAKGKAPVDSLVGVEKRMLVEFKRALRSCESIDFNAIADKVPF